MNIKGPAFFTAELQGKAHFRPKFLAKGKSMVCSDNHIFADTEAELEEELARRSLTLPPLPWKIRLLSACQSAPEGLRDDPRLKSVVTAIEKSNSVQDISSLVSLADSAINTLESNTLANQLLQILQNG